MEFLKNIFDKLVDWSDTYNRYKTAAALSSCTKDREELEKILNDLYK